MGGPDPVEHLRQLIEPLVAEQCFELVDLQVGHGRVRVFLDKEGGVGVDDCARMHRAIANVLKFDDPVGRKYALEVSSPGLDRPLKTPRDFARCIGRKVKIHPRQQEGAPRERVIGVVLRCDDDSVTLEVDGSHVEVVLGDIEKAHLEVEF